MTTKIFIFGKWEINHSLRFKEEICSVIVYYSNCNHFNLNKTIVSVCRLRLSVWERSVCVWESRCSANFPSLLCPWTYKKRKEKKRIRSTEKIQPRWSILDRYVLLQIIQPYIAIDRLYFILKAYLKTIFALRQKKKNVMNKSHFAVFVR